MSSKATMQGFVSSSSESMHSLIHSALCEVYQNSETTYKSVQQQAAVYFSVLNNSHNLIFVAKTGGGKSAVYLVPVVYEKRMTQASEPKATVLVSPLKSLTRDMLHNIISIGLSCQSLKEAYQALSSRRYYSTDIILVSYEDMENSFLFQTLIELNSMGKIRRVVIDEVHCVYYHNEFRSSASFIQKLSQLNVQHIYISATLPPTIESKVISSLHMEQSECITIRTETVRENIEYRRELIKKTLGPEQQIHFCIEKAVALRNELGGKCIIYVSSVETTKLFVDMAASSFNLFMTSYHGKMDNMERNNNDTSFTNTENSIMVATSGYGLGLNKADVNSTVLFNIAFSRDIVAQLSGRAARAGGTGVALFVISLRAINSPLFSMIGNEPDELLEYSETKKLLLMEKGCFRENMHYFLDGFSVPCYTASNCKLCFLCRVRTPAQSTRPYVTLSQRPTSNFIPPTPVSLSSSQERPQTPIFPRNPRLESAIQISAANALTSELIHRAAHTDAFSVRIHNPAATTIQQNEAINQPSPLFTARANRAFRVEMSKKEQTQLLEDCLQSCKSLCVKCTLLKGLPSQCSTSKHRECFLCFGPHFSRECVIPKRNFGLPVGTCYKCTLPQELVGFVGRVNHLAGCTEGWDDFLPLVPISICSTICHIDKDSYDKVRENAGIPGFNYPREILEWYKAKTIMPNQAFMNGIIVFLIWCDTVKLLV